MTRGEEFDRLQFRATREKNNSLLEYLSHPDSTYESNLVPTELKGRDEEALAILVKIHGEEKAIEESKEIKESLKKELSQIGDDFF